MKLSNVVVAYFLIGAVMWGGGVIQWDEAGVGQLIISNTQGNTASPNEDTSGELTSLGGPIQEAASTVSGSGLLAVYNIVVRLLGYLFWPITTLQSIGAPVQVQVIMGGPFAIAFVVVFIRVVRGSS